MKTYYQKCIIFGLAWFAILPTYAQEPQPQQNPQDVIKKLADLPQGRFRKQFEALRPAAKARVLKRFNELSLPAADHESLHVHGDGTICYACQVAMAPLDEPEVAPVESSAPAEPPISFAPLPSASFPDSLKFHSRPGASNVIYLNFAGDTIFGTTWNTHTSWLPGSTVPIIVKPFNIAGEDPAEYSDLEQQRIQRTWMRVAEDYAPFDIDVTTERPSAAIFATNRVVNCVFSERYDANGNQVPLWALGNGVSTTGTFGNANFASFMNPSWVFHDKTNSQDRGMADIASHEIGHAFGLSHDGVGATEYYPGHGTANEIQWNTIMGDTSAKRITQWSKGEYLNANNTQDDLAIIAARTGYRADDHANANTTATPLIITSGTTITSTTPETDFGNLSPQNKGIISSSTDTDVFTFYTGAGSITLNVNPFRVTGAMSKGTNLDVSVELFNSAGTLVASANPATDTIASITYTAAAGRYFLHVKSTGAGNPLATTPTGYTSYGSLGQYFISGSIVAPALAPYPAWVELNYLTGSNALATANPDSDGFTNLEEFAYGTNPNAASSTALSYVAGGAVSSGGAPIAMNLAVGGGVDYRAIFTRRKDHAAVGLTYVVQFSADMTNWVTSTDTPTILTGDNTQNPGNIEAVSVPYPLFVPVTGGYKKPTFFRITVTMP